MRLVGEKVLTVRFSWKGGERNGERAVSKGDKMSPYKPVILLSVYICSLEIFYYEKICFKRARIPGGKKKLLHEPGWWKNAESETDLEKPQAVLSQRHFPP